ncbi:MAG: amidohydrolase family protein [Acidimicrobiia bacterium]|nr:amidohydrolase family protein [Acidimicrobiia bacterium]
MSKTLIKGGCVLTLGARTPNFPEGDVLIEGGLISEVGTGLRSRGAEVIDARDTIVMPGFVDTHRHVWKSLFKHLGESNPSSEVMDMLAPDDLYAATLVGLLGALEAGTTTVMDWCDAQQTNDHLNAAIQAHTDAGLRTVLAVRNVRDARQGPLMSAAWAAPPPEVPLPSGWDQARAAGLQIHSHVREGPPGLVAKVAATGVLGPHVTLVHCAGLDEEDFRAIADSGAHVSITPSSEMASGLGLPPLQGLLNHKIRPGLGVDHDTVVPADMFAQMRAANSIQHAALFDLKLAGKGGLPNLLNTRDVIRFATLYGANSIGLGETTGSIEVGKSADIIVLRADRPNIAPINDPIGAVVWGMDTSNLDWVFVGGRALMRAGSIEADLGNARSLAAQTQGRVMQASSTSRGGTG